MILPEPKIFSLKPGVIQHMVNYSNNSFSLDNHLHTVLFNFMGNINPLHIKLIIGVFVVLTFCLGIWLFFLLIDIIHICIKNLLLYIKLKQNPQVYISIQTVYNSYKSYLFYCLVMLLLLLLL